MGGEKKTLPWSSRLDQRANKPQISSVESCGLSCHFTSVFSSSARHTLSFQPLLSLLLLLYLLCLPILHPHLSASKTRARRKEEEEGHLVEPDCDSLPPFLTSPHLSPSISVYLLLALKKGCWFVIVHVKSALGFLIIQKAGKVCFGVAFPPLSSSKVLSLPFAADSRLLPSASLLFF